MKNYFRKFDAPKLTSEEAARQSKVAHLAYEKMPAGTALAFLNTHHDALGGRPIDLAIESTVGLLAVERAITALTARDA